MPLPASSKKPAVQAASPSASPTRLLFLAIGLIVGFLIGYGAGRVLTGAPINPLTKNGFDDGYAAAEQRLVESGLIPTELATTTADVTGVIKDMSGSKIILTTTLTHPNPLSKVEVPVERTVTVTDSTEIFRQIGKTPAELDAEFRSFEASLEDGGAIGEPPAPYTKERFSLTDLRPDMIVQVTADHDIFFEADFEAIEIVVLQ